jgi:hypothetical protein
VSGGCFDILVHQTAHKHGLGTWHSAGWIVYAGHRLKISVPKEGVTIAMAPSGVRAPQRAMPAMHGRPAVPGEPYGEEAYLWTREHFNQRDVSAPH